VSGVPFFIGPKTIAAVTFFPVPIVPSSDRLAYRIAIIPIDAKEECNGDGNGNHLN